MVRIRQKVRCLAGERVGKKTCHLSSTTSVDRAGHNVPVAVDLADLEFR